MGPDRAPRPRRPSAARGSPARRGALVARVAVVELRGVLVGPDRPLVGRRGPLVAVPVALMGLLGELTVGGGLFGRPCGTLPGAPCPPAGASAPFPWAWGAADRNSGSTAGRCPFSRGPRANRARPPQTSRCRSGGATRNAPGSRGCPSMACAADSGPARSRIIGRRLGAAGATCSTAQHGGRKIGRQMAGEAPQGLDSPRGGADDDEIVPAHGRPRSCGIRDTSVVERATLR